MSHSVIYEIRDHVAMVTLKPPPKGNPADEAVNDELVDVCQQINQNDDIYTVAITGAGKKTFFTGDDSYPADPRRGPAAAVAGIDRPVIAAVNGDAFGEGLEIALSCDVRIASDKARFSLPQIAKGRLPSDGGTQRLSRIIGKSQALELLFTARIIGAEEALSLGLVSKVVPAEDLPAEVEALTRNIADKGPVALRYIKEAVRKGMDLTLEQGLRLESDLYFLLHTTADRTEGIRAFQERRTPRFRGK